MKNEKTKKTTAVYMKSEFWMTVLTSVSGLLLAFGVITPAQSSAIASIAPQIIGAIMALFSTSKFISVQHDAKVEVFRAMCAMKIENADKAKGKVTVQSTLSPEEQVAEIAAVAGL